MYLPRSRNRVRLSVTLSEWDKLTGTEVWVSIGTWVVTPVPFTILVTGSNTGEYTSPSPVLTILVESGTTLPYHLILGKRGLSSLIRPILETPFRYQEDFIGNVFTFGLTPVRLVTLGPLS